jgi:hypothetical protein
MTLYRLVLIAKLISVLVYAGGLTAAFVAKQSDERRLAVHSVASTGLLTTWSTGFILLWLSNAKLFELWIVGALLLSLASHLALVHSVVRQNRSTAAFTRCAVPLVLVICFMVVKPTWNWIIK